MSDIEKQRKAQENKYFHDADLEFKITSRRRKLLGLWAAQQMIMDEEQATEYAIEVVTFGVTNSSEGAVVNKVLADMNAKGLNTRESEVREKMDELQHTAEEQVIAEMEGKEDETAD